jgi:hypothetical protein
MAITEKKWRALTNEERVDYVRKGRVIAKPEMGLSAKAKLHDDEPQTALIRYVATCRGIQIGIGKSEDEAIRDGQKWLSEWDGTLPEPEKVI